MRRITVLFLGFALLLGGCKLVVITVEGGNIGTASGRHSCFESNICVIEVNNTSFNETFIATPTEGYVFSHWLSGENMLCGGSSDPSCKLDNRGLAGNNTAEAIIASDDFFYILPVFAKAEEPSSTLSPQLRTKYNGSCVQCHGDGSFGAPIIHNESAWAPRLAKGLEALLGSVKGGLGAMPPGGNCGNCSDDDYRALITYMSGPPANDPPGNEPYTPSY